MSNFPTLDKILAEADSDRIREDLDNLQHSAEALANSLRSQGFKVSASTIRAYRRFLVAHHEISPGPERVPPLGEIDTTELDAAKILIFDIETIPATVNTYDLKPHWLGHKNVVKPGDMLCFAAGWYHQPGRTIFMDRIHQGYDEMLIGLWRLLDEAAYVVGWNSDRFDLNKVRGYFARAGLPPFLPPKSIDLMKTARTFGFESASLDYTARMFGVTRKIDNGAVASWQDCMAGDEAAWRRMRKYNRGDVQTTTELFDAMRPWLISHPAIGGESTEEQRCPRCGSTDLTYVGVSQAVVIRYKAYRCHNCKGLCRSSIHSRASVARPV